MRVADRHDPAWVRSLAAGLEVLGIAADPAQQARLLDYVALLARWNRAYNLTAVREPLEMIPAHLLDSLVIHPYLQGERILDLGTGPGLPGLPLAVVNPERSFTLLDSNGKKTRFVEQAVTELGLANVQVVRERADAYRPAVGFDCITARAFSTLGAMLRLARPLLREGRGRLLAMKGQRAEIDAELQDLVLDSLALRVIPLQVPQLQRERHLVRIVWS
jgi:16S rRNA (guanine527-N7)-methyltransferase